MNGKKEMLVYVKLDEYQEIKEIIGMVSSKLEQAKQLLEKVEDIKKKEDDELANLSAELKNVEEKMDIIDEALADPGI